MPGETKQAQHPFSLRLTRETRRRLDERSRRRGEPRSRLAERLIDEGLRMEAHPGIVFRDGPAGRRAALASGPDVWELVRFIRELDVSGDAAIRKASETLNLSPAQVETALSYYADHRKEIDLRIREDEEAAKEAHEAWRRRQAALA